MKKISFLLTAVIFTFVFTNCDPHARYIECYDYAGLGISNDAWDNLEWNGFTINTIYTGNRARQFLRIVANNPASNSNDTYYKDKTYRQVINWLDGFYLPRSIAAQAKNSITAYCYIDVNSYYWAVFVEDVSYWSRGAVEERLLENNIIPKEGYEQEEAVSSTED